MELGSGNWAVLGREHFHRGQELGLELGSEVGKYYRERGCRIQVRRDWSAGRQGTWSEGSPLWMTPA